MVAEREQFSREDPEGVSPDALESLLRSVPLPTQKEISDSGKSLLEYQLQTWAIMNALSDITLHPELFTVVRDEDEEELGMQFSPKDPQQVPHDVSLGFRYTNLANGASTSSGENLHLAINLFEPSEERKYVHTLTIALSTHKDKRLSAQIAIIDGESGEELFVRQRRTADVFGAIAGANDIYRNIISGDAVYVRETIVSLGLSTTEMKIFAMAARGCKNAEISAALSISEGNVSARKSGIYKKLEIHRTQTAITYQVAGELDIDLNRGVLQKEDLQRLHAVLNEIKPVPSEQAAVTEEISGDSPEQPLQEERGIGLTVRERLMLTLKARGFTNKQVGNDPRINIIETHVATCLGVAYGKMGVENLYQAIVIGLRDGDVVIADVLEGYDIEQWRSAQSLSKKQYAVLQRIAEGQLNKRISKDLSIQEATVFAHVGAIYNKLPALTRGQATALYTIAIREGINLRKRTSEDADKLQALLTTETDTEFHKKEEIKPSAEGAKEKDTEAPSSAERSIDFILGPGSIHYKGDTQIFPSLITVISSHDLSDGEEWDLLLANTGYDSLPQEFEVRQYSVLDTSLSREECVSRLQDLLAAKGTGLFAWTNGRFTPLAFGNNLEAVALLVKEEIDLIRGESTTEKNFSTFLNEVSARLERVMSSREAATEEEGNTEQVFFLNTQLQKIGGKEHPVLVIGIDYSQETDTLTPIPDGIMVQIKRKINSA